MTRKAHEWLVAVWPELGDYHRSWVAARPDEIVASADDVGELLEQVDPSGDVTIAFVYMPEG